ncbi:hypothetical protein PFISCL1PPCAC_13829, partial [Pristionchus fissidentatus]
VPACNGCRAFFRRVVVKKTHEIRCNDDSNRSIMDCSGKTNCKKCRFYLCLMAGMRPWRESDVTDIFFPF